MVGFWDGLPVSPVSAASEDTLFKTSRQQSGRESSTEQPLSPSISDDGSHHGNPSNSQHDTSGLLSTQKTIQSNFTQTRPVEFVAAGEETMDKSADFVAKLNTTAADSFRKQDVLNVQDDRRKKLMERLAAINKQKQQLTCRPPTDDEEVVVVQETLQSPKRNSRNTNINNIQPRRKRKSPAPRIKSRAGSSINPTTDPMIIDVDAEPPAKPSRKKRSRTNASQKRTSATTEMPHATRTSSRVRRPRTSGVGEIPQHNDKPGPMPLCMSKCKRLQYCKKLVTSMLREPSAAPFSAPVQDLWPEAAIPKYFDVIKKPMDLGTIKKNLQTNSYICQTPDGQLPFTFEVEKFADDVRQVFRNAHIYNRKGDAIFNSASALLDTFENSLVNIPLQCVEEVSKEQPKRGRGKGRGRKSKAIVAKESDLCDQNSEIVTKTKSNEQPISNNAATEQQAEAGEESEDFMDDGMTATDLKERLSYLQRCRVPVIARTPVPEGSGYLTRAALLYNIEMKWEAKKKCTDTLHRVPPNKLPVVIDMIREGLGSDSSKPDDGEFVFDADQLDNKTMRNIQAFMEDNVPGFKSIRSSTLGREFNNIEAVDDEIELIRTRLSKMSKPKQVSKPTNVSRKDESFFGRYGDHGDSSSSEDDSSSDESDSDDDSDSSDEE